MTGNATSVSYIKPALSTNKKTVMEGCSRVACNWLISIKIKRVHTLLDLKAVLLHEAEKV